MSMCTLGMSGELETDGIAVNSLWPKTGGKSKFGAKNTARHSLMVTVESAILYISNDNKRFTEVFSGASDETRPLVGHL